MKIGIDDLFKSIENYSEEDIKIIKNAYEYAKDLHEGQYRQSGEPYIIHPVNVAFILSTLNADCDTICAGLLHDTLEDTPITKEDIAHDFNKDIANLVDGVTKISKMNFSSKQALNNANIRKIITGLTEDVRIIVIKLSDRLHNMRTLEYKTEFKQKENSLETMEIFVPLAYYIGAYQIKNELEDISLRYLKPDKYEEILEMKIKIEEDSSACLKEMLFKIKEILNDKNIPNEIIIRTKNIYGIYKKIIKGQRLYDIHDLLAMKLIVDDIDNCYRTLGIVHSVYHPINDMFKDYICNPKTNLYQSIHTTVFGPDERLVQMQIRTTDMDKVATNGITSYWDINKGNARDEMQNTLREKSQIFKNLIEINSMYCNNQDFVNQIKIELFSDNVYVYTTKGNIVELPKGSTLIDFAYRISTNLGNTMIGAYVNDKFVEPEYILQNKDRVRIITNDLSYGPKSDWENVAITARARKKIREFNKQ